MMNSNKQQAGLAPPQYHCAEKLGHQLPVLNLGCDHQLKSMIVTVVKSCGHQSVPTEHP